MKKILALSLSIILLISVLIPMVSASICEGSNNGLIITGSSDGAIIVEKTIKDGENWVNYYIAEPGEIIRFKITVTYNDWDGPGLGYLLKDIEITDILPEGLTYLGNSNYEETSISPDEKTITWYFDIVLYDTESQSVEFDAEVASYAGTFINNVEINAVESCYDLARFASTQATVISGDGSHDTKYKDVDEDTNNEKAIDEDDDSTNGYEVYEDPDDSSDDVLNKDGDNDNKIDHFVDINGDDLPDKYWDPDDDVLSDIWVVDVDYDGTDEWVYDSDGDENFDKYYDLNDGQIYDFVAYTLTVSINGLGNFIRNPDGPFAPFYLEGFVVELTAIAQEGWTFKNYSGDVESTDETVSITMDGNKDVLITFSENNNDNGIKVNITKPEENTKYFFNIKIKEIEGKTEIIGPINVKAEVESEIDIEKVEFYLNDELMKNDIRAPYNYWWLFKRLSEEDNYTIKVIAYDEDGNSNSDTIEVSRSRFSPFLDHKGLTLALIGLGVLYIFKNKLKPVDEVIPEEPEDSTDESNQKPVVNAGGPYSGIVGEEVKFSSEGTYDPDYHHITYAWDFGDGSTSSGENPSHKYDEAKTYTVKLIVTDELGESASDITTVVISDSDDENGGDDYGLFWYIVTALAIILTGAVALLYYRRHLYV